MQLAPNQSQPVVDLQNHKDNSAGKFFPAIRRTSLPVINKASISIADPMSPIVLSTSRPSKIDFKGNWSVRNSNDKVNRDTLNLENSIK